MDVRGKKIYLIYKLLFTLISMLIISKLTILGDYHRYINANPTIILKNYGIYTFINSTFLTEFIVGSLMKILRIPLLVNVLLSFLSYIGVKYFFDQLSFNSKKHEFFLLSLLFLPTFNVWSSIAGKEVFGVFSSGIIAGELINLYYKGKMKKKILFFIGVLITYVYKKQYLIFIFEFVFILFFSRKVKQKKNINIYISSIIFILNIFLIYIFKDKIDELSKQMILHFSQDARSTRSAVIWEEKYGFFYNMPYGIFLSLWGPTLSEIKTSVLHKFAFIESFILYITLILAIMWNWLKFFNTYELKLEKIMLLVNSGLMLFIVQYPFGALNPGSAIRYRTNIYIYLIMFVYIALYNDERGKKI